MYEFLAKPKRKKGKKFESFTSFKFKERDNGGSMSRKQLTEILVKKFEVKRPTVASIISQWIQDGSVYAANGIDRFGLLTSNNIFVCCWSHLYI